MMFTKKKSVLTKITIHIFYTPIPKKKSIITDLGQIIK